MQRLPWTFWPILAWFIFASPYALAGALLDALSGECFLSDCLTTFAMREEWRVTGEPWPPPLNRLLSR